MAMASGFLSGMGVFTLSASHSEGLGRAGRGRTGGEGETSSSSRELGRNASWGGRALEFSKLIRLSPSGIVRSDKLAASTRFLLPFLLRYEFVVCPGFPTRYDQRLASHSVAARLPASRSQSIARAFDDSFYANTPFRATSHAGWPAFAVAGESHHLPVRPLALSAQFQRDADETCFDH